MAFSPFGGGPVTIDHENIVKAYSASPSMLGRGHTLLEPQGPVWVGFLKSFAPPRHYDDHHVRVSVHQTSTPNLQSALRTDRVSRQTLCDLHEEVVR